MTDKKRAAKLLLFLLLSSLLNMNPEVITAAVLLQA
jgi:hypothetical protein